MKGIWVIFFSLCLIPVVVAQEDKNDIANATEINLLQQNYWFREIESQIEKALNSDSATVIGLGPIAGGGVLVKIYAECSKYMDDNARFTDCFHDTANKQLLIPEYDRQRLALLYQLVRQRLLSVHAVLEGSTSVPDPLTWEVQEAQRAAEGLMLLGNSWRREKINIETEEEHENRTKEALKTTEILTRKLDNLLGSGQGQALQEQISNFPSAMQKPLRDLFRQRLSDDYLNRMLALIEFSSEFDEQVQALLVETVLSDQPKVLAELDNLLNKSELNIQQLAPDIDTRQRNVKQLTAQMKVRWPEYMCADRYETCSGGKQDLRRSFDEMVGAIRGELRTNLYTLKRLSLAASDVLNKLGDDKNTSCPILSATAAADYAKEALEFIEKVDLRGGGIEQKLNKQADIIANWFLRCKQDFIKQKNKQIASFLEQNQTTLNKNDDENENEKALLADRNKKLDEAMSIAIIGSKQLLGYADNEAVRRSMAVSLFANVLSYQKQFCPQNLPCLFTVEPVEAALTALQENDKNFSKHQLDTVLKQIKEDFTLKFQPAFMQQCLAGSPAQIVNNLTNDLLPNIYIVPTKVKIEQGNVEASLGLYISKTNLAFHQPVEFCKNGLQQGDSLNMPYLVELGVDYHVTYPIPKNLSLLEDSARFYQDLVRQYQPVVSDAAGQKQLLRKLLTYLGVSQLQNFSFLSVDLSAGLYLHTNILDKDGSPLCLALQWDQKAQTNCIVYEGKSSVELLAQNIVRHELSGVEPQLKDAVKGVLAQFSDGLVEQFNLQGMLQHVRKTDEGYEISAPLSAFLGDLDSDMENLLGQSRMHLCYRPDKSPVVTHDVFVDPIAIIDGLEASQYLRVLRSADSPSAYGSRALSCGSKLAEQRRRYDVYLKTANQQFYPFGGLIIEKDRCKFIQPDNSKNQAHQIQLLPGINLVDVTLINTDLKNCFNPPEEIYLQGRLQFPDAESQVWIQSISDEKRNSFQSIKIDVYIGKNGIRFDSQSPEFDTLLKLFSDSLLSQGLLPPSLQICNIKFEDKLIKPVIGKRDATTGKCVTAEEGLQNLSQSLVNLTQSKVDLLLADPTYQTLQKSYASVVNVQTIVRSIESNLSFIGEQLNDKRHSISILAGQDVIFTYDCDSSLDYFSSCDVKLGPAMAGHMKKACSSKPILTFKRGEIEISVSPGEECLKAFFNDFVPGGIKPALDDIDKLVDRELFNSKLLPENKGILLGIKVPVRNQKLIDAAFSGIAAPVIPLQVKLYWDGRFEVDRDLQQQLNDVMQTFVMQQLQEELKNLDATTYLREQLKAVTDQLPSVVRLRSESAQIVLSDGDLLLNNDWIKNGKLRHPAGLLMDADLTFGDQIIELKGIRWVNKEGKYHLSLQKVNLPLDKMVNTLRQKLNMDERFENWKPTVVAQSDEHIVIRIKANSKDLNIDSFVYAMDALELYFDVTLSLSKGFSLEAGSDLALKKSVLNALRLAVEESGILVWTTAGKGQKEDSAELRFKTVKTDHESLIFEGELLFNNEWKIIMPASLRIPIFGGNPEIKVESGGIMNLLRQQVMANIPLPTFEGFNIIDLRILPHEGIPQEIQIDSSAKVWEVVSVIMPTISISPRGVELDKMNKIGITYDGDVQVPPFSISRIGGSLSDEGVTAHATLAPVQRDFRNLLRVDGEHVYKFEEPLKLESHAEMKLLNFMTLGKTYRAVDLGKGSITQSLDLGGVARDIIDFKGQATATVGNQEFAAQGRLSLFNAFAGADAKFKNYLISGKIEASGNINIENFLQGNLDFKTEAFYTRPRGRGNLRLQAGDFRISDAKMKVTDRLAYLRFKLLGVSLGLGMPNLLSFNEDAILDLIKNLLSPDFSNLDKALLSLLKGNFAFNPMSSFGGGDGSGLDGDSDGDTGEESGRQASADGAGGYGEMASNANATEGVGAGTNSQYEVINEPPGDVPADKGEVFNKDAAAENVAGALPVPDLNQPGDIYHQLQQRADGQSAELRAWRKGMSADNAASFLSVPNKFAGQSIFNGNPNWISAGQTLLLDIDIDTAALAAGRENLMVSAVPHQLTVDSACQKLPATYLYWFTGAPKGTTRVARQPMLAINPNGKEDAGCWGNWQSLMFKDLGTNEEHIFKPFLKETAYAIKSLDLDCESQASASQQICLLESPIVEDAFWLPAIDNSSPLPNEGPIALAVMYHGDTHYTTFVYDQSYVKPAKAVVNNPLQSGTFSIAFLDRLRSSDWTVEQQTAFLTRLLNNDPVSTEVYEVQNKPVLLDDSGFVEWDGQTFLSLTEVCGIYCGRTPDHEERKHKKEERIKLRADIITQTPVPDIPAEPFIPGEVPEGMQPVFGNSAIRVSYADRIVKAATQYELQRFNGEQPGRRILTLPADAAEYLTCEANNNCKLNGRYLEAGEGYLAFLANAEETSWKGNLQFYFGGNNTPTSKVSVRIPREDAYSEVGRFEYVHKLVLRLIQAYLGKSLTQNTVHDELQSGIPAVALLSENAKRPHTIIKLSKDKGVLEYTLVGENNIVVDEVLRVKSAVALSDDEPSGNRLWLLPLKDGNKAITGIIAENRLYLATELNALQNIGPLTHLGWNSRATTLQDKEGNFFTRILRHALQHMLDAKQLQTEVHQIVTIGPQTETNFFWVGLQKKEDKSFKLWRGKYEQQEAVQETQRLQQLNNEARWHLAVLLKAKANDVNQTMMAHSMLDASSLTFCNETVGFNLPTITAYESIGPHYDRAYSGLPRPVDNLVHKLSKMEQDIPCDSLLVDKAFVDAGLDPSLGQNQTSPINFDEKGTAVAGLQDFYSTPRQLSMLLNKLEDFENTALFNVSSGAFMVGVDESDKQSTFYLGRDFDISTIPSFDASGNLQAAVFKDIDALLDTMKIAQRKEVNYQVISSRLENLPEVSVLVLQFNSQKTQWLYLQLDNAVYRLKATDDKMFAQLSRTSLQNLLTQLRNKGLEEAQILWVNQAIYILQDDILYPFRPDSDELVGISGFSVPESLAHATIESAQTLIQELLQTNNPDFGGRIVKAIESDLQIVAISTSINSGEYALLSHSNNLGVSDSHIKTCGIPEERLKALVELKLQRFDSVELLYPLTPNNVKCDVSATTVLLANSKEGTKLDFLDFFESDFALDIPKELQSQPLLNLLAQEILSRYPRESSVPVIGSVISLEEAQVLMIPVDDKKAGKQSYIYLKPGTNENQKAISKQVSVYDLTNRAFDPQLIAARLQCIATEGGCGHHASPHSIANLYITPDGDGNLQNHLNYANEFSVYKDEQWQLLSDDLPDLGILTPAVIRALDTVSDGESNFRVNRVQYLDNGDPKLKESATTRILYFNIAQWSKNNPEEIKTHTFLAAVDRLDSADAKLGVVKLRDIEGNQKKLSKDTLLKLGVKSTMTNAIRELTVIQPGQVPMIAEFTDGKGYLLLSMDEEKEYGWVTSTKTPFLLAVAAKLNDNTTLESRQLDFPEFLLVNIQQAGKTLSYIFKSGGATNIGVEELRYSNIRLALEGEVETELTLPIQRAFTFEEKSELAKVMQYWEKGNLSRVMSFTRDAERFLLLDDALFFGDKKVADVRVPESVLPAFRQFLTHIDTHFLLSSDKEIAISANIHMRQADKTLFAAFRNELKKPNNSIKVEFAAAWEGDGNGDLIDGSWYGTSEHQHLASEAQSALSDWLQCQDDGAGLPETLDLVQLNKMVLAVKQNRLTLLNDCITYELGEITPGLSNGPFISELRKFLAFAEVEKGAVQGPDWRRFTQTTSGRREGSEQRFLVFERNVRNPQECENETIIVLSGGRDTPIIAQSCESLDWDENVVNKLLKCPCIKHPSSEIDPVRLFLNEQTLFVLSDKTIWKLENEGSLEWLMLPHERFTQNQVQQLLVMAQKYYKENPLVASTPLKVLDYQKENIDILGFETPEDHLEIRASYQGHNYYYQIHPSEAVDQIKSVVPLLKVDFGLGSDDRRIVMLVNENGTRFAVSEDRYDLEPLRYLLVATDNDCAAGPLASFRQIDPKQNSSLMATWQTYYLQQERYCQANIIDKMVWFDEQNGKAISFQDSSENGRLTMLQQIDQGFVELYVETVDEDKNYPWQKIISLVKTKPSLFHNQTLRVKELATTLFAELYGTSERSLWMENYNECSSQSYYQVYQYSTSDLQKMLSQSSHIFDALLDVLVNAGCPKISKAVWFDSGQWKNLGLNFEQGEHLWHIHYSGQVAVFKTLPARFIEYNLAHVDAAYEFLSRNPNQPVQFQKISGDRLARHNDTLYLLQNLAQTVSFSLSWKPIESQFAAHDSRFKLVWDNPPMQVLSELMTKKDVKILSLSQSHMLTQATDSNGIKQYYFYSRSELVDTIPVTDIDSTMMKAQVVANTGSSLIKTSGHPCQTVLFVNQEQYTARLEGREPLEAMDDDEQRARRANCFAGLMADMELEVNNSTEQKVKNNGFCLWHSKTSDSDNVLPEYNYMLFEKLRNLVECR